MHHEIPSRRRVVLIGLAVAFLASGCGDDTTDVAVGGDSGATTSPPATEPAPAAPPDRAADTDGQITTVSVFEPIIDDCTPPASLDPDGAVSSDDPPVCTDPNSSTLGSVLVEEVPGQQEGDKYSLTIDRATALLRAEGDGFVVIGFADLAEGQTVDVWIDGPVAESYPAQATATALVVTA